MLCDYTASTGKITAWAIWRYLQVQCNGKVDWKKSIVILNQICIGSEFVHPDISKNNWQLQMTEGVHVKDINIIVAVHPRKACQFHTTNGK